MSQTTELSKRKCIFQTHSSEFWVVITIAVLPLSILGEFRPPSLLPGLWLRTILTGQSSVNMIFSAGLECLKKENREQFINEIDGSGLFSWKIVAISHLTQC